MADKDADGDKGDDYMRTMQAFHMDTQLWDDIAYNHAHDPDGREFYEGRGFGIRPGSQCRHNTATHSLVVMGDFRVRVVTGQIVDDIARFYYDAQRTGLLPRVPVRGHRDAPVTGDCGGTTCPGTNLYNALPTINTRINALHEGEDDMPSPKDWVDADWEIFRDRAGWAFPAASKPGSVSVQLTRIENNTDTVEAALARIEAAVAAIEVGDGITPAEVSAIVRAELDKTKLGI